MKDEAKLQRKLHVINDTSLILGRKVNSMDKNEQNDSNDSALKIWLEDNLRVLLSILIVIAIAGGIYSYSNRSQSPSVATDIDIEEETQSELLESLTDSDDALSVVEETEDTEEDSVVTTPQEKQVTSAATETSKETEGAFVESAQRGDGMTHLARRAVNNYLEKNPDSGLTVEHKIYIEDYLRKNVSKSTGLAAGSSVEFSKDMIHGAIEKSKSLDDKQLQNLKKYSARAPSIR